MTKHVGVVSSSYVLFSSFIYSGGATAPFIRAYPFQNKLFSRMASPATLPASELLGVAVNTSNNVVAYSETYSPYVGAYNFTYSGWGTKASNPATLPTGQGNEVFWNGTSHLAVSHDTSPFVSVYAMSGSTFGTKFSNPSTAVTTTGNSVTFSPSGDAIVVSVNSGTRPVDAYAWSGSGFGTKYANPSGTINYSGTDAAFSPAGNAIVVASGTSLQVPSAWRWSAGSGFGTRYSNATNIGDGYSVEFNPSGDVVINSARLYPYLIAWEWSYSGGFGTAYSTPTVTGFTSLTRARFNNAGTHVAIIQSKIGVLPFNTSTGWGTISATTDMDSTIQGLAFV